MTKLILGLTCGAAFSFATGVLASSSTFRAGMVVDQDKVHSYKLRVVDVLQPMNGTYTDLKFGDPIGILFGPLSNLKLAKPATGTDGDTRTLIERPYGPIYAGSGFVGYLNRGVMIPLSMQIYNTSAADITVDPIQIQITVKKLNADRSETVIYTKKTPMISDPLTT